MNKISTIGIDARMLGVASKGLGRYIAETIKELEKIDKTNLYLVFMRQENWEEYQPKSPNFKKILADFTWYGLSEQIFFPLLLRRHKVDLMHYPHFNVPIFCRKQKFIVTIHDMILSHFSTRKASLLGPIGWLLKKIGYRLIIRYAILKSEAIIAPSNFTKKDIVKHFNINNKKINVIHEGIPLFKSNKSSASYLSKKIQKPYFLYVGNAYPHKNLEKLLSAFAVFKKHKDMQLVLVGRQDYFYQRLSLMVKKIGQRNIVFLGEVPDGVLAVLYKNANAYIFPSLYEGFGLPALEAMIYGTPVLSAKAGAMPEVLGDAALYFDPLNINEIVSSMDRITKGRKLRKELKEAGYQQVEKYSWSQSAKLTLKIYEKVLEDVL